MSKETSSYSEKELTVRQEMVRGFNSVELVYVDPTVNQKIKENYLKNENYALVIVGNHQSHADIFGHMQLAKEMLKEVNDNNQNFKLEFDMIIALSLTTGHQDSRLKEYFDEVKEMCKECKIGFLPIVRPKDKEKYGLSTIVNFALFKKAFNSYKDKTALIEFPEGTVKAGRINLQTGQHFGVQKIGDSNITDYCVEKYLKKGINFNILPVATDGSYNIYPPDEYKFHVPQKKVKVTVGQLLGSDDFKNLKDNIRPSDLVMLKIMPYLSKENQGDYYPNLIL